MPTRPTFVAVVAVVAVVAGVAVVATVASWRSLARLLIDALPGPLRPLLADVVFRRMAQLSTRGTQRGARLLSIVVDGKNYGATFDAPGAAVVLRVCDSHRFVRAVLLNGDTGLGETYTDGDVWTVDVSDVEGICQLVAMFILANRGGGRGGCEEAGIERVAEHYDVGNDFYARFLTDPLMAYSCGFFLRPDDDLAAAQRNKVDAVVRKLAPARGERVLDVGCGWGRIAKHVADATGAKVTGTTVSAEQLVGAPAGVDVRLCDMLSPACVEALLAERGPFDKIYSIGMMEHVGGRRIAACFANFARLLADGGLLLVHCITAEHAEKERGRILRSFISKHIFPGGEVPNVSWVLQDASAAGFSPLHVETFGGQHYARTLREWRANLIAASPEARDASDAGRRVRTFEFYFAMCEAVFRTSECFVTQFLFVKRALLPIA
jgi:cyclopropane fatty-acyl-phospholipid synthase-like methyltransferase